MCLCYVIISVNTGLYYAIISVNMCLCYDIISVSNQRLIPVIQHNKMLLWQYRQSSVSMLPNRKLKS